MPLQSIAARSEVDRFLLLLFCLKLLGAKNPSATTG